MLFNIVMLSPLLCAVLNPTAMAVLVSQIYMFFFIYFFYIYSGEQIRCVINPFLSSSYVLTALLGVSGAGLGSSLGAVPGGQPSTPNLNPPSQIDPSSIERAYAALGLTYQGNQIQAQTAQPNMPNQGLQGQAGMRTLNPMGELGCMFTCYKYFH